MLWLWASVAAISSILFWLLLPSWSLRLAAAERFTLLRSLWRLRHPCGGLEHARKDLLLLRLEAQSLNEGCPGLDPRDELECTLFALAVRRSLASGRCEAEEVLGRLAESPRVTNSPALLALREELKRDCAGAPPFQPQLARESS